MIDERELVERAIRVLVREEPSFDDVIRRRDHKRRNQRITAGVVGIAVFVAAVWIVTNVSSLDRSKTSVGPAGDVTGPVETGPRYGFVLGGGPTYTLGPVTPKDIALGYSFMDAWVEGDGEAAAAMFSPEGTFDGFQPAVLPALHDWFRAEGWTFGGGGCGLHGYGPRRGVVGCGFTYENDLTRALGMPPVESTLSFNIDAGGIETAWYGSGGDTVFDMFAGYRGFQGLGEDVLGPVWDMFIDWISSRHPEDFVRMYDPDRGYPILDPTSNELWKRYTGEFVASPQGQALALSIRDAGWDGVGIPPEGTAPSTPVEGEVVARYARIHVGWVFVYADGRVISFAYGPIEERRLTPEGVKLVRSGEMQPQDLLSGYRVPVDALQDPEPEPYVPSRYAICYYQETGDYNRTSNYGYEYPSTVLHFFPAPARAILEGKDHAYERSGDFDALTSIVCSEVTTDEARDLDAILSGVRVEDSEGDEVAWEIHPILPHAEWIVMYG